MKLIFLLFLVLISPRSSFAKYRVYVLKKIDLTTSKIWTIKSTLDPEQYKSFHQISSNEKLSYIDTWICPGSTQGFEPLCESNRKLNVDSTYNSNLKPN